MEGMSPTPKGEGLGEMKALPRREEAPEAPETALADRECK